MKARVTDKKGWKLANGTRVPAGTILEAHEARLAYNAGAAERWGPKERKAYVNKLTEVGSVVPLEGDN